MWQLYVFGSLLASATENVIDKVAIIGNTSVNFSVATFWRSFLFFVATVLIGLTGWLGPLHFHFHWSILLLAPIGIFQSSFYTYLLQKVELTSTTAIAYLAPFFFLLIDAKILHTGFSPAMMLGIFLLVCGGIGFSLDAKTLRLKSELSKYVWGIFLFGLFWTGSQAYLFKYLNATYEVNGVSFFASMWLIVSVALFLVVVFRGKFRLLLNKPSRAYIKRASLSKSCDAVSTVLWAQALTFVAVSQVGALEAFYPLVLFLLVVVVQSIFKISLNEQLDRKHLVWKIVATVCLVVGGYLIS